MFKGIKIGLLMIFGFVLIHCSDAKFTGGKLPETAASETETGGIEEDTPETEEMLGGLTGGHFDLDVALDTYPFYKGYTDHHVHEYDDRYNVNYADFFDLLQPQLKNIQEVISGGTAFKLIVGNSHLSTGAYIEVNGKKKKAQAMAATDLGTFSIDGISGTQKLTSLKVIFHGDAIVNGGLIPSSPKEVIGNTPGANGEYRSGALVIQAVNANHYSIDPDTGTAATDSDVLWEGILFWHKDFGFGH